MTGTLSRRCTARTRAGDPCRAWAVRGSMPPRCAAHAAAYAGADAPGRKHGFYARTFSPDELDDLAAYAGDLCLDDEISVARVALQRVFAFLNRDPDRLDPGDYVRAAELAFTGARTIARLLRDRDALTGSSADELDGIVDQALDLLSAEWGIDL